MIHYEVIAIDVDGYAIRTTPDHPFLTANCWVDADNLKPGDRISTDDGT